MSAVEDLSDEALRRRARAIQRDANLGPDGHGIEFTALEELQEVRAAARAESAEELTKLRARVAELEAPPVVPEGWLIELGPADYVELSKDGRMHIGAAGSELLPYDIAPDTQYPLACIDALLWARRTGKRPPHEADQEAPRG